MEDPMIVISCPMSRFQSTALKLKCVGDSVCRINWRRKIEKQEEEEEISKTLRGQIDRNSTNIWQTGVGNIRKSISHWLNIEAKIRYQLHFLGENNTHGEQFFYFIYFIYFISLFVFEAERTFYFFTINW